MSSSDSGPQGPSDTRSPGPPGTSDFVTRLNEAFAAIAGWSFDHRWVVLGGSVLLVLASLSLAGAARIDNSYEAYFAPSDQTFQAYEQYRDDFGSDEVSYIMYEAPGFEHGVWNLEVMRKVESLTEALIDETPFIYDVKSLTNAELIEGVEDGIDIEAIEDEFPETQAELLAVRERVLRKPMLVGGLASEDGQYGAFTIEMDRSSTDPLEDIRLDPEGGDELDNLYPQVTNTKIEEILAREEYEGLVFYHGGDVPLNALYNEVIAEESETLDAITSLLIAAWLFVFFRSVIGAIAPIIVVQMSIILCVCLVIVVGWKLDMSFGSMPTLLTAIGVAHSVHILSEFRLLMAELGDRREALVRTIYLVGAPCLLTSVTTAAGFASMSFAPIKSIAHQGVYGSFGVLAAFFLSITLLMAILAFRRAERVLVALFLGLSVFAVLMGVVPALGAPLETLGEFFPGESVLAGMGNLGAVLAYGLVWSLALGWPLTMAGDALWQAIAPRLPSALQPGGAQVAAESAATQGPSFARRALMAIAEFNIARSRALLVAFAGIFLFSIAGISQLVVDSNWLDDFSDRVPLKGITIKVDRVMGGSTNLIYLFDAGESDGIKNPEVLREIERIQKVGEAHSETLVRKTYSIVDIIKDLNQAFHGGDPAYYTIPESRELVAQYLLLYETSGGEEAEEYVSPDYRTASLELRLALAMTSETAALAKAIDDELAASPLVHSDVAMTGIGALWLKLLDYIVSSQLQSFTLAFCVIAVIMVTIFRSLKTGMISMLPNLAPILLTLGFMGWSGIPLDYSKIMIAAVAMGIAVDDTIHLLLRYRHEFLVHGDYAVALREAMADVGRALVITSIALVTGFSVLLLSVFDSQATYGILLSTTIVVALVADFLLLPSLILTFQPFGPEGGRMRSDAGHAEDPGEAQAA